MFFLKCRILLSFIVFVEEWSSGGKGYFVNWWEVTPYMIGIPWNLKRYWQSRLREMVEAWIGGNIPLENTDIYGIRRYEDGARLLTHVDRESTHAVSMIINVCIFCVKFEVISILTQKIIFF